MPDVHETGGKTVIKRRPMSVQVGGSLPVDWMRPDRLFHIACPARISNCRLTGRGAWQEKGGMSPRLQSPHSYRDWHRSV